MSDEERIETLRLYQEEWSEEVAALVSQMRGRNWPGITLGTICSVSGAALAGAGALAGQPEAMAGLLLGAVAAALKNAPPENAALGHPMAYAALAQARLS